MNGIFDTAIGPRQAEIHDHCRATAGRGPSARFKCLCSSRAHKRHFQMGVRINAAGNYIGTFGIDILVALQVLADLLDRLALGAGDGEFWGDVAGFELIRFGGDRRGAGGGHGSLRVEPRAGKQAESAGEEGAGGELHESFLGKKKPARDGRAGWSPR